MSAPPWPRKTFVLLKPRRCSPNDLSFSPGGPQFDIPKVMRPSIIIWQAEKKGSQRAPRRLGISNEPLLFTSGLACGFGAPPATTLSFFLSGPLIPFSGRHSRECSAVECPPFAPTFTSLPGSRLGFRLLLSSLHQITSFVNKLLMAFSAGREVCCSLLLCRQSLVCKRLAQQPCRSRRWGPSLWYHACGA